MERKLATVLFVDLVGSTELVTGADPEVVRRRVTRFFDDVTHCVTTHGGIVEKFAGDAVLAGFGVAQAHEDDAERAIRAGLGILEGMERLGLEARIGIESGEVVVDSTESTFATGQAVNLAARLQQAAGPGELLIGPGAHSLAGGQIETEAVEPVDVKGRHPLLAWRVVCASDRGQTLQVPAVAPLVGRTEELELLANTFERTVRDRRAHVVTIYGEPGVGKSRLAREFVGGLEGATVLGGRCLPYGEGITYWPLAEMVKSAAGISDDDPVKEAMEKLRMCCEDEAVADLLGLAAGVLEAVESDRSGQEIAWAAREWADQLADVQPLVLVFEDIHWAEDPLFELVEHLATWVRESPLLIICLARPELVDVRPAWGGGRMRAAAIELDPLREAESEELIDALAADTRLSAEARRALREKTEGNPLFVEETMRMLAEHGDDDLSPSRVPDTLQALIAARIDQLPPEHKALLHRAAVIGRIFWRGAIAHSCPESDVDLLLDDLILRNFLLAEPRSTIIGERAFRFKHMLIREVAYTGLTKAERAQLHARFAEWLGERAGDELLEIRAYHLDHATQLLAELDGVPPADLAQQTAAALEEAGRRALAREANRSGRKLLLRSVELEPTLLRRYHAARAAWRLSDLPAVSIEMERVLTGAREAGDSEIEGKALTALAEVALLREADVPKATELIDAALDVLPDMGRFTALGVRSRIAWFTGDFQTQESASDEALEIARRLERKDLEAEALNSLASVYKHQWRLDEAEEMLDRGLELAEESGSIGARAQALESLGALYLDRREPTRAMPLLEEARSLFSEIGESWMLGRTMNTLAWAAEQQGDLRQSERLLREAISVLKRLEDRGTLCESQRALAEVLVRKGSIDEAERLALEALETVGEHDLSSRATTSMTMALVRAAQGRDEEAEALLDESLAMIEPTDFRGLEAWIISRLDAFLRERGRDEEADVYARRLAELSPASGVATAFAARIDRIA